MVLVGLVNLALFSYGNFYKFRPTNPSDRESKVKGAKTESITTELPELPDSEELSSNRTSETEQIIIKTSASSESVYKFYKNILLSKGWTINGDTQIEGGYVTKYSTQGKSLVISVTSDQSLNKRIVGIEVSYN